VLSPPGAMGAFKIALELRDAMDTKRVVPNR
jgi:hypothetical protein